VPFYIFAMSEEQAVREFASVLQRDGLHAALAFLNSRTPHRFTAVYSYDGHVMRNVMLFDRMDPQARRGIDVAVADAYCGQVAERRQAFEFRDTRLLAQGEHRPQNPVVCYCGVVIADRSGGVWGTLCHYDFKPCQMRKSDIPVLEAVATLVYDAVGGHAAHAPVQAGSPQFPMPSSSEQITAPQLR
jgi:hypothetical protein